MGYEVTSDGVTVWVNGSEGCIGRFGLNGIDIHRPASEQVAKGQCLHCTHALTTAADWDTFVREMNDFFGVKVRPQHRPDRLK
jgi:hypothetical protein